MQITGNTRLGGLLGSPVRHSISPMMHNESFLALGLDYVYLCFDVGTQALGRVIPALREMNVYGFNLTMPDKEAVLPLLDELSREAALIGAVNTVVNDGGRLIGYNTDGTGFLAALPEGGREIVGKELTVMGAGGAASAIAVQAAINGAASLHLACRKGASWQKAVSLADRINETTGCQADVTELKDLAAMKKCLEDSALLVNATSAGMAPHTDEMALPDAGLLRENLLVCDVIYHPEQTLLLQKARQAGCRVFNGLGMLLYQGAEAFRLWTGQEMPMELVRQKVG